MRVDGLYSGWVATLALVLIAWLASSPTDTSPTQTEQTVETATSVLAGKTIVVDPGHGGMTRALGDFGTEGVGPVPEKEIVLQVALELEQLLNEAGADVVMTRRTDVNPAQGTNYESIPHGQLMARVETAQHAQGDVFVSIHGDANDDTTVHGTTTYYYHDHSEALARYLQEAVVEARNSRDLGARRKGFMVVREVPMPSALVEIGFLTNPEESIGLADPEEQRLIARALFDGLTVYFEQRDGA